MKGYVCGFFVSPGRDRVLLIRKRRPAWQAGRLNGVGGKIEPGETPAAAIRREFREEAGLDVSDWREGVTFTGTDWFAHFYVAFGDVDAARAMTDEALEIHPVRPPPDGMIDNLNWILPLLLDADAASGHYRVGVLGPGSDSGGTGNRFP